MKTVTLGRPQAHVEPDHGAPAPTFGQELRSLSSKFESEFQSGGNHLVRQLDGGYEDPGGEAQLPGYRRTGGQYGPVFHPFSFDAIFIGRAGVEDPGTNVKMTQVGFNYQARIPFRERTLFTIRPLADILFLSGPGGEFPILPEQLYKIAIDLQADVQITDVIGVSIGLTPGFWTDFIRFNGDAFRLPVRILGTYRASETLFLAAGALYSDNIYHNVFPVGGVIWDVNEKIRLEAMFPRSRAVYTFRDDWQIYAVFEGTGATYSITSDIDGVIYDEEFLYRDFRVMLGTQSDYFRFASLFVEVGGVFARKFKFDDSIQPDLDVNPAFICRLGARF